MLSAVTINEVPRHLVMSLPRDEFLGSAVDSSLAKEKPFSEEILRGGISGGSCIRGLVSKKKKRYSENGFNLDLSYITDRIIAMGFPSVGTESCYRNPMSETKRFFEQLHGLERVKVYNLCCEREYPSEVFGGRVEIYPFPDHNAPPFEMIRPMCLSVEKWLDEHPKNVVAIHCKAGKGRTGVMVCALLLHGGLFVRAVDAMNYYARARTVDNKGLTIPSQIRYVEYYETLLQNGPTLCPQLRVNHVRFSGLLPGRMSLVVIVRNNRRSHEAPAVSRATASDNHVTVPLGVAIAGNAKFEVFRVNVFGRLKPLCHFWVHTSFMEYGTVGASSGNDTVINKVGLDKINKDKTNRIVSGDFSVSINSDLISFNSHLIHHENSGITSSSAQEITESSTQPPLVSHTVAPVTLSRPELMRVLYEYAPTEPGHLTVGPGDLLYVLRKDPSGWWLASFDGQVGWIPHNFAKAVAKGRNSLAQA